MRIFNFKNLSIFTILLLPSLALASLKTSYSSNYHHQLGIFVVHPSQNGYIELSHDPNKCSFDQLGKPQYCTMMPISIQKYQLTKLETSTEERLIFQLGESSFRLLVIRTKGDDTNFQLKLIIRNTQNEVLHILPLNKRQITLNW